MRDVQRIPGIPHTLCESGIANIYTPNEPDNINATPPQNNSKLQNDPLGSTKIANWEQKLFLSSPTRPPQHTEKHRVVAWFVSESQTDSSWQDWLQTPPYPTREANEPKGSTGTAEEENMSQACRKSGKGPLWKQM